MTAGDERRVHERVAAGCAVAIRAERWRDVEALSADNISRGGLFIGAADPPPVGTRLEVSLSLPDGERLDVVGEVVHSIDAARAREADAEAGFGVRFDAEHTLALETVHELARARSEEEAPAPADALYITVPATLLSEQGGGEEQTRVYQLVTPPREDEPAESSGEASSPSSAPSSPAEAAQAPAKKAPRQRRINVGSDAIFGIDFGTAYTSVAVVAGGQLSVLKDDDGNTMFPSVVHYPEQGAPVVGWRAREQLTIHPRTTISSVKRLIGRSYDDRNVAPLVGSSAVPLAEGPGGMIVTRINGDQLALPQICAEVLRHAAALAEQATGQRAHRVLLSAPVGFTGERRALKRAAELAQLKVVAIVDEPVAAAVGCGLGRNDELAGVYDFGGGTFDFTLLEVKGGQFRVVAKAGDAWLGGDDFDLALAEHAASAFWKTSNLDLRQRAAEWQRLVQLCEAAKRQLSSVPSVELLAKEIAHTAKGPLDLRITLTHELLAELCGELVRRSIETVSEALQAAGVQPTDIGHMAMTGGVSRMPLVREKFGEFFGRPIQLSIDPQHAVAIGTAVYANLLTQAVRKKLGS